MDHFIDLLALERRSNGIQRNSILSRFRFDRVIVWISMCWDLGIRLAFGINFGSGMELVFRTRGDPWGVLDTTVLCREEWKGPYRDQQPKRSAIIAGCSPNYVPHQPCSRGKILAHGDLDMYKNGRRDWGWWGQLGAI